MPKKSSSKTPTKKAEKKEQRQEEEEEEEEEAVVEQKKQSSSTPKRVGNEIDEIFAGKKRKKPEEQKIEKPNGDKILKPITMKNKKKNKKSKENKEEGFNESSSSRPRMRTADGFAIYSEEELGINKSSSGGTPLCPFDCDCCF